ncbi:MAG: Nicotinamide-nucleotide amidohydrolase PncC [Chlamydiae bacterium]|nr:Nicotinamide-nucleotide amidohydrolase PncC [Chlamydiota bacterium]
MIKTIHQKLIQKGKTLALAESCTGGSLSAAFTAIPDASKYFLGSFVTYSNGLKSSVLGVSSSTLYENGAISRETANEMLLGLMKKTEADFGVAITGVAGPSGGTKETPVGTVYIAVGAHGKKPHVTENHFEGSRQEIMEKTCQKAIEELLSIID